MASAHWDEPLTYVVEGFGDFPADMLRRDMSWPTSSDDAAAMGGRERRRVCLTAARARYVAPARWESFGWRVVDGFDQGFPVGANCVA